MKDSFRESIEVVELKMFLYYKIFSFRRCTAFDDFSSVYDNP